MEPVWLHVPEAGSYSSAVRRSPLSLYPPATSTLPLGSSVAVWPQRAEAMEPVSLEVPEAGSYTSAVARLYPPATRTLPLGSRVAVCSVRLMAPVALQVSEAGSYNSDKGSSLLVYPPATNTWPVF